MYKFVVYIVILGAWSVQMLPVQLDISNPRNLIDDDSNKELRENEIMFAVPKDMNVDDLIKFNIKLMQNYKRLRVNVIGANSEGLPDFNTKILNLTLDFEKEQIYYTLKNYKKYVKTISVRDIDIKDNLIDVSLRMQEDNIAPDIYGICLDSVNLTHNSLKKISFLQISGHVEIVKSLDFRYDTASFMC